MRCTGRQEVFLRLYRFLGLGIGIGLTLTLRCSVADVVVNRTILLCFVPPHAILYSLDRVS